MTDLCDVIVFGETATIAETIFYQIVLGAHSKLWYGAHYLSGAPGEKKGPFNLT